MARTDPEFIEDFKTRFLTDRLWRVSNLHRIKNMKPGAPPLDFNPNPIQHDFYRNQWYRNVILKPRGIGSTTGIMLWVTDLTWTTPHCSAAICAHTEEKAIDIFRDHVLFAYQNCEYADYVPPLLPGTQGSQSELQYSNNARISVEVNLRSGSYQALVSTELGPISFNFPEKAKEFISGGLPTARDDTARVFIESTAEGGPQGVFYDLCLRAREETNMIQAGKIKRGPRSYRFHFFPWFADVRKQRKHQYPVTKENAEYFEMIERTCGVKLTDNQKWWYCETAYGPEGLAEIGEMHCNYPSTFDEAFEAFVKGAYFTEALNKAQKEGRIGSYKYDPMYPVDTWWDLGLDGTAIWFTQTVGNAIHVIWYYDNCGFDLMHYIDYMSGGIKPLPWPKTRYAKHVGPHDTARRSVGDDASQNLYATAANLGYRFEKSKRPSDKQKAIQSAMIFMARCRFDKENCARGLQRLQNYRPGLDHKTLQPTRQPVHDINSHGGSAFETLALNHDKQNQNRAFAIPAITVVRSGVL